MPIGRLLNSEWLALKVVRVSTGVKGGRCPAQRTLDAGAASTLVDMADAATTTLTQYRASWSTW
jgi:hypothetical protein